MSNPGFPASARSNSATMCGHAIKASVVCRCPKDCDCYVHGSCGIQVANDNEAKFIDVFSVPQSCDDEEYHRDYFTYYYLAEMRGRGRGLQGGDYVPQIDKAIVLPSGATYLLKAPQPIALDRLSAHLEEVAKQNALAKLTEDEKRILGIK